MAGGLRIEGNASGNVAEVDSDNQLNVVGAKDPSKAGFMWQAFEQNGSLTQGISSARQPLVSLSRRLAVGLATKLFDYQFLAAVQNTNQWKYAFTTLTMTQGSGTLLMNSGAITTTTTGAVLSTWRYFNFPGNGVVSCEIEFQNTLQPLAGQQLDMGFFQPGSATTAPADGAYFRYTSAGLFGIVNFNGTETPTAVLLAPSDFVNDKNYTLKIDVGNDGIDFWRDNVLLATLAPANANGTPFNWGALPLALQARNTATLTGSVMQTKVSAVTVNQRDIATFKSWAEQQAAGGCSAYYGSEGGTIGTSALYTNSLAPGAGAAMTNTTAALGSGLGGQFSALPTLAANTDGVIQSFQNPVGSVTQPPRTLYIKGVWLKGVITTVLTGGPLFYLYSLAFGHTAVSLATAETASFATATTKAARRIALGIETYVVTAPVGTLGQGVYQTFDTPIVVNPGEFIALVGKNVGTVTTTGVITWLVGYDAYFE
jgi:hypothetical protein